MANTLSLRGILTSSKNTSALYWHFKYLHKKSWGLIIIIFPISQTKIDLSGKEKICLRPFSPFEKMAFVSISEENKKLNVSCQKLQMF